MEILDVEIVIEWVVVIPFNFIIRYWTLYDADCVGSCKQNGPTSQTTCHILQYIIQKETWIFLFWIVYRVIWLWFISGLFVVYSDKRSHGVVRRVWLFSQIKKDKIRVWSKQNIGYSNIQCLKSDVLCVKLARHQNRTHRVFLSGVVYEITNKRNQLKLYQTINFINSLFFFLRHGDLDIYKYWPVHTYLIRNGSSCP